MTVSLVLTCIGADKPGLVERLAETIAAHGGNWEASRMAHLAGHFAGILLTRVPEDQADALAHALQHLSTQGLHIVVHHSASTAVQPVFHPYRLELTGHDHPGIVRDISRILANLGVNVEELHTACTSAAMAGGDLFQATALIRLPEALSVDELCDNLAAISHEIMVDVVVREDV